MQDRHLYSMPMPNHRLVKQLSLVFLYILSAWSIRAESGQRIAPRLVSESAILIEQETGRVLFEKDPDTTIAPASLSKLLTMHIVLDKIKSGELKREQLLEPPEESWYQNIAPGSSLMFLSQNQVLSVDELLKGLVVSSGNDAAVALAILSADSVESFVDLMNEEARNLGFSDFRFYDPAGLSAENRITARRFAEFCRIYIELHPESLSRYHSLESFTYPMPKNMRSAEDIGREAERGGTAAAGRGTGPIKQFNRNRLLGSYPGLDGLKTGFIDESGYNIALSAKRDGMRLVAVLLGAPGETHDAGYENLKMDGTVLLDYGFSQYRKINAKPPEEREIRIWKGRQDSLIAKADDPDPFVIKRGEEEKLSTIAEIAAEREAPIEKGEILGGYSITLEGKTLAEGAYRAVEEVEKAGFLKRIWHSFLHFFVTLGG